MGEREFASADLRLAAIVASSDDAIVSKDLDGTIQSWNRGAELLFGYTAEEVIGRSIRIIIPHDRQSEEDDVLARIRRGESIQHFETIRLRKDGTLIPISLTVSPLRNEAGRVVGVSKIARDLSERRRAERDLETRTGAPGRSAAPADDARRRLELAAGLAARRGRDARRAESPRATAGCGWRCAVAADAGRLADGRVPGRFRNHSRIA